MAFAEAVAHGLPIVAARAGAVPQTVPGDAALLVEPDDADAFSDALHALISDKGLRQKLSDAAWARAQALPRWEDAAEIIAHVIHKVER
jgi:glycosyltransferase involved in cell wall biosynthesis